MIDLIQTKNWSSFIKDLEQEDCCLQSFHAFSSCNIVHDNNKIINIKNMPFQSGQLWLQALSDDECKNLAVLVSKLYEDDRHKVKLYFYCRHLIDVFTPGWSIDTIRLFSSKSQLESNCTYFLISFSEDFCLEDSKKQHSLQVSSKSVFLFHTNKNVFDIVSTKSSSSSDLSILVLKIRWMSCSN
jgi:hypothetical protein